MSTVARSNDYNFIWAPHGSGELGQRCGLPDYSLMHCPADTHGVQLALETVIPILS
jgi:hypothetical protein